MLPAIAKENVLLAGDAAGQVMATSGGGIPLAMVGGLAAGEVAARHIEGVGVLDEYPSRIAREMGKELDNSVRIRQIVDKIMKSDRLMDALFAMLPSDQMKATMRGQIPKALDRVQDLVANR
jgi:digeranylgeranylglycerophospholipid reductase